jgi:ABC-type branched-subunit amino acid transport system substrate-binding protein
MQHRGFRRFGSFLAIAALVLVGACANSKDDAAATKTTGGSTSSGSAIGVTDDEIRVAVVTGEKGTFDAGVEIYAAALNAAGGVNGRKIRITSIQADANDAQKNAAAFGRVIADDKPLLVALASGNFGGSNLAIREDLPVVGTAYDNNWHKSDSFFGIEPGSWKAPDPEHLPPAPASIGGAVDAYIAGKLDVTRVGVFGYNISSSAGAAKEGCDAMKPLGVDCVFLDTSLSFGFTDIGASLAKIKAARVQYIVNYMDLNGCIAVLRSLKRAGIDDIPVRCFTGYTQDAIEKYADVIGNLFIMTTRAPYESNDPEMKRFLKELAERKPGLERSDSILLGWITGAFIEDAVKALGDDVTRDRLAELVRHDKRFSKWDGHGLTAPKDYTTNQWKQYLDPNFKPDPAVCSGYLLRPDVKRKRWVQVGEKPKLCVGSIVSPSSLKKKLAEDKSSLGV